jgi:hypothetical protein
VQKVLEDANVKLGNVLTDLFGVSGQLMLEALLKGQATPEEICQGPCEEEDPAAHRGLGRASDE